MPASRSWYHTVVAAIARVTPDWPGFSQERLALLITGIMASRTCVIAQVARELQALELTGATRAASIARRLRRAMNDPHLATMTGYAAHLAPLLVQTTEPLVLVMDESSQRETLHLLRIALPYRGSAIPVAWVSWPQNRKLPAGTYWRAIEQVLAAAVALLPAGQRVVLLADRAYAVPNWIDRVVAVGWHWIVRMPSQGSHCWQPQCGPDAAMVGPEERLRTRLVQTLPAPGSRVRLTGRFAKKAGWRAVNLVGVWARGQREPLVLLSDLPPRWALLATYRRRFWIEAGFRLDKSHGWDWEASQVRDPAHHQVLLLALAWATLLVQLLGATEATRRAHGPWPHVFAPARESVASLGLALLRRWLYHPDTAPLDGCWTLPDRDAPSWWHQCRHAWGRARLALPPVRP